MKGRLPNSAQEIAEVIGIERTLYLIGKLPRAKCGTPGKQGIRAIMYVPKNLKPDHPLVRILGWCDAERLSRHFPGEILCPATCHEVYRRWRDQGIRDAVHAGLPIKMAAEWFSMSDRQIRNLVGQGCGHCAT